MPDFEPCTHVHDNEHQAQACATAQWLHLQSGRSACAVVILEDVGDGVVMPHPSVIGDTSDFAIIVAALCDTVLAVPRPADCKTCAAAWDRLTEARACLASLQRPG